MKWRILISTISIPIVFAFLAAYTIYLDGDSFRVYVAILFLILVILRIPLSERKYLSNFIATYSTLQIQYYTPALRLRSRVIPISDVRNIELKQVHWIFGYVAELNIKSDEEFFTFIIFRKEQMQQLRMKLDNVVTS